MPLWFVCFVGENVENVGLGNSFLSESARYNSEGPIYAESGLSYPPSVRSELWRGFWFEATDLGFKVSDFWFGLIELGY